MLSIKVVGRFGPYGRIASVFSSNYAISSSSSVSADQTGANVSGTTLEVKDMPVKPTKLYYKGKMYNYPLTDTLKDDFTIEEYSDFQRRGFYDIWGFPHYSATWLGLLKPMDPDLRKAWRWHFQMRDGRYTWQKGKHDHLIFSGAAIMLYMNLVWIVICGFYLICPKDANPFNYRGDENLYMGFKDWIWGRKMHDAHH